MFLLLYFINIDRVTTKTTAATTTTTPPIPCSSVSCKLSNTVIPVTGGTVYYVTTYGGSFFITGNTTVNTVTGGSISTNCAGYCAYAASNFGIANTCGLSTISAGKNCINSAGTIFIGGNSAIASIGPGTGNAIPIVFAGIPPGPNGGPIFNIPATGTSSACIDNPGYYCCCDTSSG